MCVGFAVKAVVGRVRKGVAGLYIYVGYKYTGGGFFFPFLGRLECG